MLARDTKTLDDVYRLVTDYVREHTNDTVFSGPFAGMKLLPDVSWRATTLSPMLLGCYECELHTAIEQEIERLSKLPQPRIANLGCGQGYYAVGFAKRIPHACVFAVDIDEDSLAICMRTAELNNTPNVVRGVDITEIMTTSDLFFIDVEGNEITYLDLERFPSLTQATMIVEIHNLPETSSLGKQQTDMILFDRFKETHNIAAVFEGGRNPNYFEFLGHLNSTERWLAVTENRPCLMDWFVMRPKGVNK